MVELNVYLDDIQIATENTLVYKDESVYDFDTPESPNGLFICLKTFYGVSAAFLRVHHVRTGSKLYLNIIRRRKFEIQTQSDVEERPTKRTKLTNGSSQQTDGFEEERKVVLYAGDKLVSFELSDPNLPVKIRWSVHCVLTAKPAFAKEDRRGSLRKKIAEKIAEKILATQQTDRPQQINGANVPACSKCNQHENLWQSLTDGTILCGRREMDSIVLCKEKCEGSSEINLAVDANSALKLGAKQKTNRDKLKLLYGLGYVGMENLGNSCYLSAVMQVLLALSEFRNAYSETIAIYKQSTNPMEDFSFQMAKLVHGLYSKHYINQPEAGQQKGIRPTSFKQLVGRRNPEFATRNQQDAEEFFRYIIDLIDTGRDVNNNNTNRLSDLFKFKIEERTECLTSDKVDYAERTEYCLSLPIPLEKAAIRLVDCLDQFARDAIIEDYLSPETKTKTSAKRWYRIKTFPDYLMLHMQKFTMKNGVTAKIDCSLNVPDVLDLAFLRGLGLQHGEQLLPDDSLPAAEQTVNFNSIAINSLMDLEFSLDACKRALMRTNTTASENVEAALDWLLNHGNDPDFETPTDLEEREFRKKQRSIAISDQVKEIMDRGYKESLARRALKVHNDVRSAIDYLLENKEKLTKEDALTTEESMTESGGFLDGKERYELVAFISHVGSSAQSGHYVCHIRKVGQWVLHDDSLVALDEQPPIDLAYMYLYKRAH